MLRQKPKSRYSGLTIIMSNPSRFDSKYMYLLSGESGVFFNNLLQPEYNQMMCDVRLMEDKSDFIPDTKCILLLGEAAMHEWDNSTRNNTLNELRGSVLSVRGLPAIASFFPQDAIDFKNYEAQHNEDSKDYNTDDKVSSDDEDEGDIKAFSLTSRSNYSFWLKADVRKIKQILTVTKLLSHIPRHDELQRSTLGKSVKEPIYKIYPPADEVINILTKTKNEYLYFDMETDYEEQNMLCFSFSFGSDTIYCVPVLNTDYRIAYSSMHFILRALCIAIRDNIIVAHNGNAFDFLVLAYKYHIPVYRCYDTLLAMHRCFPSVEKSLGHCTSYWTWERFHKDTDSEGYFTRDQMMAKLKYCGKDVYTMYLIKKAIDAYAKTIPGLETSIACANDSIRPYLLMSLQGILYDQEELTKITKENDRKMMQYIRICNLLIGAEGMAEVKTYLKGKSKTSFLASNKQQCAYFHDILGYPVMYRSETTGLPSLGKKLMYRLAMKYPENPLIQLILHYRKIAKMTSALKFVPFKKNGKVYELEEDQKELLYA